MLDTHVLIWAVSDPERLDGPTRAAIVLPDNQVLVSIASVWEIAIKQAQGRLESIMPSAGAINDASDGPRDASGGTSAPSSVPVGESGNPLFVSIAWGTHRHKTMAHIYPSIGPNQPSAPQPHEHRTQHGRTL